MAVRRRVVTLLPAATEIVAALGAGASLVGVSHECDYPGWVAGLPRLTATPIDTAASAGRIDEEVRRLRAEGRPVIAVDGVYRLANVLDPSPEIISLGAINLAGIWSDIARIARALDLADEADELVLGLQSRLARLDRAGCAKARPRVLCLEWLEPAYVAGHWVPELVAAAGGHDVGAAPGAHSTARRWSDLARLEPDVILVMLCGFGVERAARDLDRITEPAVRRVLDAAPVWVLDGNAYTSRPGPRVVDGAERIRAALEQRELAGLQRWRQVTRA